MSHSLTQSQALMKDSLAPPMKRGDKNLTGLKDSRGLKVKKIKTVNYGSDTGEKEEKRRAPMVKLSRKRKESQPPQPWRTPPTAVNNTTSVEIKRMNKVDWNVVKNEQVSSSLSLFQSIHFIFQYFVKKLPNEIFDNVEDEDGKILFFLFDCHTVLLVR